MSTQQTTSIPVYHQDGLPYQQRILAIATVVLTLAIAMLDGSIANLALPYIAKEMQTTASDAIWIVNSYQIAMAILLLPLASLGEVVGYRKIYLTGIVVFTIASLLCAMSDNIVTLSLARTLQGIGAAGIMSVNAALIRFIYPQRLLGTALGYNALVAGTSSALGPTLAGFILHLGSWHWLFLINVPIGIFALMIGKKSLPFNELSKRRYDYKSALFCMLFVGSVLYAIDAIGHEQDLSIVCGGIALALVAFAILLKSQAKDAPMLPIDLLKIKLFTLSISTSFCSFSAQMAILVMLPFFMQDYLAIPVLTSGLLLSAWPISVALTAPFAGKLVDKIPSGWLGCAGMAIMAIGVFALIFVTPTTPHSVLVILFFVGGFGFGLFQSPNNKTIIGSAPRSRTGGASGMLGTARLLGQTFGATIVAFIFAVNLQGYTTILVIAGTLCLFGAVVSMTRVRFQH